MNMVVPKVGTTLMLADLAFVYSQSGQRLVYRLFKNDLTPDADTVIGDLTEADFSGYAAVTINTWDYGGVTIDGSGRSQVLATSNATFTHNGGATDNDCYGYYVTHPGGGLYLVQRFDSPPIVMDGSGLFITVVPRLTMKSQF